VKDGDNQKKYDLESAMKNKTHFTLWMFDYSLYLKQVRNMISFQFKFL